MVKRGRMQYLRSPQLCKPHKFYSSDIHLLKTQIMSAKILFWQAEHLKSPKCFFLKCSEMQSTLMCFHWSSSCGYTLTSWTCTPSAGRCNAPSWSVLSSPFSPHHWVYTREESQLCTAGSAWCQHWENHRAQYDRACKEMAKGVSPIFFKTHEPCLVAV